MTDGSTPLGVRYRSSPPGAPAVRHQPLQDPSSSSPSSTAGRSGTTGTLPSGSLDRSLLTPSSFGRRQRRPRSDRRAHRSDLTGSSSCLAFSLANLFALLLPPLTTRQALHFSHWSLTSFRVTITTHHSDPCLTTLTGTPKLHFLPLLFFFLQFHRSRRPGRQAGAARPPPPRSAPGRRQAAPTGLLLPASCCRFFFVRRAPGPSPLLSRRTAGSCCQQHH